MADPAPTSMPTPSAPSDGTSIDAALAGGVPEHAALSLAKLRLIESARLIDPLKTLREHPFATVGVAGGAGAVLGSTGGSAVALSGLVGSLATLLRSATGLAGPLASVLGPILAGKFAGGAAHDSAAAESTGTGTPAP